MFASSSISARYTRAVASSMFARCTPLRSRAFTSSSTTRLNRISKKSLPCSSMKSTRKLEASFLSFTSPQNKLSFSVLSQRIASNDATQLRPDQPEMDLPSYKAKSLIRLVTNQPLRLGLSPSTAFIFQQHRSLVACRSSQSLRSFSNDSKKPETPAKDANEEPSTSPDDPNTEHKNENTRMKSLRTEAKEQFDRARQSVVQVEERLQKVLHEVAGVTTGDQLAVASIVVLLVCLLAAPYVISQMKASTRNYDGIADTDDPVDDFTQLARGEWDKVEDSEKVSALENLLNDVVQSKALQQAAQQFVIQLFQAPEVQQALQRLLKALWKDLVEDPETIRQVINLLSVAIQDEQIKAAALKLVLDLVADDEVQASLVRAVQKLGNDKEVQKTLQILLTNTAHNTLNDAEVLDHSMEFATDVLGDDVVQQTAGEALRNTVRHAFRPAASVGLTATGVALMLFGILALGYARSSEMEAQILDTAAKSLQTNAIYGVQRLLTWPVRVLTAAATWIGQTLSGLVRQAGDQVSRGLGHLANWMIRGVSDRSVGLWNALTRVWMACAQALQQFFLGSARSVHEILGQLFESCSMITALTIKSLGSAWVATNESLGRWSVEVASSQWLQQPLFLLERAGHLLQEWWSRLVHNKFA